MKQQIFKILVILSFFYFSTNAQNIKKDSLINVINFSKIDSNKANALLSLADLYSVNNIDSAILFAKNALEISKRINHNKLINLSYVELGWAYYMNGNYPEALKNYLDALSISEQLNDLKQISLSLGNVGAVYRTMNDLDKAKEYYFKTLKIDEELGIHKWIATDISNIGVIYMEEGNYGKALEYYYKALKINEELNDLKEISIKYGNIANVYFKQCEELIINSKKHDSIYSLALENYLKALQIDEKINNKSGIAAKSANIGSLYLQSKEYSKAEQYLLKALAFSDSIGILDYKESINKTLSELYDSLRNPTKSLFHYKQYVLFKDSIFNEEATKKAVRIEMNFEFEKKQAIEKAEQEKRDAIQNAEKNKQRLILIFVSVGLLLVIAFSIFMIKMFLQKKKANVLLSQQNIEIKQQKEEIQSQRDEIESQRDLVTLQKEEIEDSIKYAQTIQRAVLPTTQTADVLLKDYFILFKPKDVVSGDFYWFAKVKSWTLVAVADCTGHGVPGGFMSMLGISFLNEIVSRNEVQTASSVLEEMRKYVINSLQQHDNNDIIDYNPEAFKIKDGMDMSFIAINMETGKMQFSGANNSIFIYHSRNQKIVEIKPDKMPVAIHIRMDSFRNHEIQLDKGDIIYMFTDGFSDQFGGPHGKKFKNRIFQNILLENAQLPMKNQGLKLDYTIEDWKTGHSEKHHQTDDITVLGIKYS